MAVMMAPEEIHELPSAIREKMQQFMDTVATELPDKEIFKVMGLGNIDVKSVYDQLISDFKLKTVLEPFRSGQTSSV